MPETNTVAFPATATVCTANVGTATATATVCTANVGTATATTIANTAAEKQKIQRILLCKRQRSDRLPILRKLHGSRLLRMGVGLEVGMIKSNGGHFYRDNF